MNRKPQVRALVIGVSRRESHRMYVLRLSAARKFPQSSLFLPDASTIGHMNDTFGARLQAARKRAGFKTQAQLGDLVGRDAKSIRNYETNKHRPPPDVLDALRNALGAFDAEGDPVEVALRQSELIKWRQDEVLSVYERNLHEQRKEATG